MNKHDQQRIKQVEQALSKSIDKVDVALLYMRAAEKPDLIEIADTVDVQAHIYIALGKLRELGAIKV